jgi:hypothetical protein
MTTSFTDFFGVSGVKASLHVGGDMLAMNSGEYEKGFAVCTKCGFSRSEVTSSQGGGNTGRQGLPKGFDWHAPIHESDPRKYCWNPTEAFVLRHLHLAARQVCDFLEIELPAVPGSSTDRRRIANTVGQALRLSGAQILNIDSREISNLRPTSGAVTRISICDSLAGGAGHVRDLSKIAPEWWRAAVEMIRLGNETQAMLSLLTADIPTREGLPEISIEEARRYLDLVDRGIKPTQEIDEEEDDLEGFSMHLKG